MSVSFTANFITLYQMRWLYNVQRRDNEWMERAHKNIDSGPYEGAEQSIS